jgi:leucyl aminopeptidase
MRCLRRQDLCAKGADRRGDPTGARVAALGRRSPVSCQRRDAPGGNFAAAGRTQERCWPLPLPEDYKELLKSSFADINNMPSAREGGAVSAALFLS